MKSHSHKIGANHRNQLSRVNKIEGQVRGIKNMIEGDKYCIDILTQIKAVRSALKSLELSVLEGHLNHCLMAAVNKNSKEESSVIIQEILEILRKSSKS